jgi:uncharacterized protein YneF (UPF0154 family)
LHTDIIKTSQLKKKQKEFKITRDIFSSFKEDLSKKPPVNREQIREIPKKPPKKTVEQRAEEEREEITSSIKFEGYVIRKSRNLASITINGEFFIDDIILERIKVVKIEKSHITVEVDKKKYEIKLKGDEDNEYL